MINKFIGVNFIDKSFVRNIIVFRGLSFRLLMALDRHLARHLVRHLICQLLIVLSRRLAG